MRDANDAEGGAGDLEAVDLDTQDDSEKDSLLSDSETSRHTAEADPQHAASVTTRSGPQLPSSSPGLSLAMDRHSPVDNRGRQKGNDAKSVSWKDLPKKSQLVVIVLARLSEPLVQTSLQSYMFYQLKWFNPNLSDSVISSQAGVLHASFTAAQFLTAMMWGRVADSSRFGRKTVLLIGLGGTTLSCLGFGFSTSFWQALLFRSMGGVTNGNIGVLRTMISETVREKKYQSRAFLLLPMTFNIGIIIGPILGGILSDPAGSYPSVFGNVEFFKRFPYAAPNILSAMFLLLSFLSVWLCLEETLDTRLDKRDRGIELGRWLSTCLSRRNNNNSSSLDAAYTPLASRDDSTDVEMSPVSQRQPSPEGSKRPKRRYTQRLPFRRIFTPNVVFTLVSNFLLAFHVGTFNSLWFVFLSTPVYDPKKPQPPGAITRRLPFVFTGGLGLQPREVGMAMAILGVLGIGLQLGVYPWLSARLGTVRSWRLFLFCFPFTYFLVPYLSLVPSSAAPPSPKDGVAVWFAIAGVLCFQVVGRTFALPAQTILVNNCTPHPSVLGTVHGIGQSVSSFARTVGPILCGFLYGLGLSRGIVGAVWWGLSGVAIAGVLASFLVREGDGHEIWLAGDEEDE